jgi:nucleoid-associated protein
MSLEHCIVHKIERTSPGSDINSVLKAEENNVSGPIFSLFEQVKHSFQRSAKKQFGHFDQDLEDSPLPQWIKEQQAGKITFASLSQRFFDDLKIKLADSEDAFEAHVLIAQENLIEQSLFYVFWLTHTEAICIDSDLEASNSRYIDSKKINYAIKLHLGDWLEQESQQYLTLISSRGDKALSDAFGKSIGFGEGVDSKEETREFLTIVDQYTDSLPEETSLEKKAQLIEYCIEQDKVGEPVHIEEISSQLDEAEPRQFFSFVSDRQQQKKAEVHTDRSSLKRYIRFFGRDKNMSISFDADRFGQDIVFEADSGRLIIGNVPKSLKQQLSKHGSKAGDDG